MSLPQTIMVIDDEQKNLLIMDSLLSPLGHRVVCASGGAEAMARIKEDPPDLILLDVMMPDIDGFDVCRQLKANERTRLIPVILVTALDRVSDKVKGFESDADDFLSKPVNRHELIARVRSCLRIKALNDRLESSESVIYAFAEAVEAKDPYTIGHSERVAQFSVDLGKSTGLAQEQLAALKKGGLLHDIGKIGVPDSVLRKPGKLTHEEFLIMQRHPVIGERICRPLRSIGGILPLIRSHHERLDGSGYPDGLKGEQISVPVRVLAIADVFDALSSDRPYRSRQSMGELTRIFEEEIEKNRLDEDLVRQAISLFPSWEEVRMKKRAGAPHGILETGD